MRRRLLAAAVVSLALLAPTRAHAEPTTLTAAPAASASSESDAPAPRPRFTDTDRLPDKEKALIRWATRIRVNAVTVRLIDNQRVLNYSKANAYDQGHYTRRRKFAAGFQMAGGFVTNISRAEQLKVNAYKTSRATIYRALPKDALGRPVCKGSNRVARVSTRNYRIYLDSCKTALVIAVLASVSVVSGVLAGSLPLSAPFTLTLSVFCALGSAYVGYLAATSGVQAIWVRYYYTLVYAGRQ